MNATPLSADLRLLLITLFLTMSVGCGAPSPSVDLDPTPPIYREGDEISLTQAGFIARMGAGDRALFQAEQPFVDAALFGEGEALAALRYRALTAEGTWTQERALDITWQEGRAFVARLPLGIRSTAIELIAPLSQVPDFVQLHLLQERPDWGRPLTRHLPLEAAESADPLLSFSISSVVSRASWGSRATGSCGAWHSPTHLTVHHTATPNSDSLSPEARMRQMQAYHIDALGWCDIGYHFVVGIDGRVFRGRVTEQRTGSHVGRHNTNNVGVSLVGNFTSFTPRAVQLDGLRGIGGWITDHYRIPRARSHVRGHRDWPGHGSNACPGDRLYAQLGTLVSSFGEPSPPTCDDECTAGARRCAGSGTEVCADHDGDGCMSWGGARDCGCGEFCETGRCVRDPAVCCPAPISGGSDTFADVLPGSWHEQVASRLSDLDITQGCRQDPPLFCPSCQINRGQAAAFLSRALLLDDTRVVDPPTFADVPIDHTFHGVIEALYAEGLIAGCAEEPLRFCPGDSIARGTAVGLLGRAASFEPVAAAEPVFTDVSADAWYRPALETAQRSCMINGCSSEPLRFCPSRPATRAEFGLMLLRFLELDDADVEGCCRPGAVEGASGRFKDMLDGRPQTDAAEALFEAGITSGCRGEPTPLFCGACPLERGAGAALLARALDLEALEVEAPTFADVPLDHRFSDEIEALAARGLISGCDPEAGLFCPDDPLRRSTAASLIARTLLSEDAPVTPQPFSDIPESAWYREAVESLAGGCIVDGCTDEDFCPGHIVSREDFGLWLARGFSIGEFENCLPSPDAPDSSSRTEDRADDLEGRRPPSVGCSCASGGPAPASSLLIALALAGLVHRRRRRVST